MPQHTWREAGCFIVKKGSAEQASEVKWGNKYCTEFKEKKEFKESLIVAHNNKLQQQQTAKICNIIIII